MKVSVIAFFGLMAYVANAVELTADNYDELSEGKTVFIKFYAPWCGHCKKMKPDWDKLMDEFKDSNSQLVAEVDCTSDGGKPLCEANNVRGYPTLKWGDPASLEDYSGQRDMKNLKKFAEENLKPICSPTHLELCEPEEQKSIQAYLDLGMEELTKQIDAKKAELDQAESDFKTFVEDLQQKYKDAMDAKEEKVSSIKASGLSLMQKCMIALKKKKHDEL